MPWTREDMDARAAKELQEGFADFRTRTVLHP